MYSKNVLSECMNVEFEIQILRFSYFAGLNKFTHHMSSVITYIFVICK